MCGIFAVLSGTSDATPEGFEGDLERVSWLLSFRPWEECSPEALGSALGALNEARALGYRLTGRAGFLALVGNSKLRQRLAETSGALTEWVRGLDSYAEQRKLKGEGEAELLNALIVGGWDLAWQLDRDVLANLELARRLAGGDADSETAGAHGWQLNLVLNNIDRLEVRGRDSAGIAVYAHFPSAAVLGHFLVGEGSRAGELQVRSGYPALSHRSVTRPGGPTGRTLLFTFKVAEEVGEMGANTRMLRGAIAGDGLLQAVLRAPGVELQPLAHTRWASNGVVSVPNCHPIDSTIFRNGVPLEGCGGRVVAVLNGDVDNYQDLFQRYVGDRGLAIDEEITTDAKIVPLVVGHHYQNGVSLEEAFCTAFEEFEGSMAIGLMAVDRPGEFLFGQKGSGQGLFLGPAGSSVMAASEMYGLVEVTQQYVKAEGERSPRGEIFRVSLRDGAITTRLITADGEQEVPPERVKRSEISTRDINRGDYRRYLLKEISESVDSVRKTLRGKFEIDAGGTPHFFLGPQTLDPVRLDALRRGAIRRILVIGQGTAAIAAMGIADLLARALSGSRIPPQILAVKATELSAHGLDDDFSGTLVIAVSQSGTTADTNRTVDLVTERGAWVIAIVNRRNSDLVYKAHGVLYTSDGRDIEMSVASTKAFYAQNVAGHVLALALAEALDALPPDRFRSEVEALRQLPQAMEATLALSPRVKELADRYALCRPYWAVVGSGSGKIAADEIRIKLSELCYKSIATDFIEDKKHIDLSAEPLILVCANRTSPSTISDLVKEVAIFKAHQSIPLVITEEGEHRFDPYASGIIAVPVYKGALDYLLATMVGHLFGYHAAESFDRQAHELRLLRRDVAKVRNQASDDSPEPAGFDHGQLPSQFLERAARMEERLADGGLDGGLRPGTAVQLSTLFQFMLGRLSLDCFAREVRRLGSFPNLDDAVISILTRAMNELARPIDAIKHQAKTVTVGVSRPAAAQPQGALWSVIREFGLPRSEVSRSHQHFLTAFEPLVARVAGATLYRLSGLDAVGRPRVGSTIRVEKKTGLAATILSRCEDDQPLAGTKWGVAKSQNFYLGYGQLDGRKILMLPIVGDGTVGHLLLYHLDLVEHGAQPVRTRALAAHASRLEELMISVTELNQAWDTSCIDALDNESLFFLTAHEAADTLQSRVNSV